MACLSQNLKIKRHHHREGRGWSLSPVGEEKFFVFRRIFSPLPPVPTSLFLLSYISPISRVSSCLSRISLSSPLPSHPYTSLYRYPVRYVRDTIEASRCLYLHQATGFSKWRKWQSTKVFSRHYRKKNRIFPYVFSYTQSSPSFPDG